MGFWGLLACRPPVDGRLGLVTMCKTAVAVAAQILFVDIGAFLLG